MKSAWTILQSLALSAGLAAGVFSNSGCALFGWGKPAVTAVPEPAPEPPAPAPDPEPEPEPKPKPKPQPPPREKPPAPDAGAIPTARPVPGRDGFVFSPYNNKLVDVKGFPSGRLVADPHYPRSERKFFRVP